MDWKIELIAVPVTDTDRAKSFYVDQVGFNADYDIPVSEELRFVQLTPPGSACSIVIGEGTSEMAPGSQKVIQIVVPDASDVDERPWGRFVTFADPDGNTWSLQQIPPHD